MKHKKMDNSSFLKYLDEVSNQGRTMLLPVLLEAQRVFGFIPKETAELIGEKLRIPLADITGVIEFYSLLHSHRTGDKHVQICTSPTCSASGSKKLLDSIFSEYKLDFRGTTKDRTYHFKEVACLGLCDHGPSVLVDGKAVGNATIEKINDPKENYKTQVYAQKPIITERIGKVDPTNIKDYIENGGFIGLRNAMNIESDYICDFMDSSGLLGRGGAAFVTRRKWESAASAPGEPKYIVCNADESEPGTFKDRVLLENDPFAILEGMLIAGFAIGAETGYIYIRGEYPTAQSIFNNAVKEARDEGLLGNCILDTDFSFDIEIRSGAGAYICGEETALFESIEGKRGFPRLKPPYPTTEGLFGKPTVINNVETFANVSLMMRIGVEKYCTFGTKESSGPWLFCISGSVKKPGLYEIVRPISLRDILEMAGGIINGGSLKTVLLGGAAGKFVHPSQLEVLLTQEDTRKAGLTLGSGAILVFDDSVNLLEAFSDLGHFFSHESCGKCYPCQLGTQRQVEILDRIMDGQTLPGDIDRLKDIGLAMTEASLCGLGQTAASAVLSAIDLWPEQFLPAG